MLNVLNLHRPVMIGWRKEKLSVIQQSCLMWYTKYTLYCVLAKVYLEMRFVYGSFRLSLKEPKVSAIKRIAGWFFSSEYAPLRFLEDISFGSRLYIVLEGKKMFSWLLIKLYSNYWCSIFSYTLLWFVTFKLTSDFKRGDVTEGKSMSYLALGGWLLHKDSQVVFRFSLLLFK